MPAAGIAGAGRHAEGIDLDPPCLHRRDLNEGAGIARPSPIDVHVGIVAAFQSVLAAQLEQAGMRPTRSTVSTQIAGADAEGARVRALLDGQPGGMDSYYRVISDRLVGLSIIGSEKEIGKSAAAWDMIRSSIKVEPPPEPKATVKPSPTPKP